MLKKTLLQLLKGRSVLIGQLSWAWAGTAHIISTSSLETNAVLGAWLRAVAILFWHHNLTEVLRAHLKTGLTVDSQYL